MALLAGLLMLTVRTGWAGDIPLVDGKLWNKSTVVEKRSYLIGASNLLDVEYGYQQRSGQPPRDGQSIIRRLYEEVDEMTLDQVIERIDGWYRDHPGELHKAVLDVIWLDMVEKQRGASR